MDNGKISILGTKYDYEITTEKDDTALVGLGGYCDAYTKRIAIESDYNDKNQHSIKDMGAFKDKVKRHEVIHAYFHESGLADYSENEQLVDWIAWQFPKMLETFKQINAI